MTATMRQETAPNARWKRSNLPENSIQLPKRMMNVAMENIGNLHQAEWKNGFRKQHHLKHTELLMSTICSVISASFTFPERFVKKK